MTPRADRVPLLPAVMVFDEEAMLMLLAMRNPGIDLEQVRRERRAALEEDR